MSTGAAWSVALLGIDGTPIEVEAAIGPGTTRTVLVGLPDAALYEARDRCRAAVAATRLPWPDQLLTINLIPASLPKAGTHYDLAIAAAVLAASGIVPKTLLHDVVLFGELGLDGRTRAVRGLLPGLLAARRSGLRKAIVPLAQVPEAELVAGITALGVAGLDDLIEVLHGRPVIKADRPADPPREKPPTRQVPADLADVVGQPAARWALEVAAAGGHHMLLHGPPGVGKTMLAERLTGLLPDLTPEESVEVSALHSLAGYDMNDGLILRPPYSAPHHTATMAAMVGGGSKVARPGAISMAHRGVLFMDEAPEFSVTVLEALRTPMESGWVAIARSHGTVRYPSRFQLLLAANPCPCGLATTPGGNCRCTPMQVRRYAQRLSGPILDRIDIHQLLSQTRKSVIGTKDELGEPSAVVAERVAAARHLQYQRWHGTGWSVNAEVPGHVLRTRLASSPGIRLLDDALLRGRVSSRGVDKVVRLAQTIADLAGRDQVTEDDFAAAMTLNQGEWINQ